MPHRGGLSGSFRSRVALRIFLLCALCSLLPTVIIGVTVYARLQAANDDAVDEHLHDLAKRYGVLLHERIKRGEIALFDSARRLLRTGEIPTGPLDDDQVVDIEVIPLGSHPRVSWDNTHHPDQSLRIHQESLQIVEHDGASAVRLLVIVSDERGRMLQVTGIVKPDFLWSSLLMDTAGVRFCVHSAQHLLSCTGDVPSGDGPEETRQREWNLFLRPHFGAADWQIIASQPRSLADAGLSSILSTFPLLAGASLVIALLISSFEVRRSHRPLTELLAAFRTMARGRFTRVQIGDRRDEYGSIGRAFNKLSGTLHRQFRLLSTFERIDQLILARPDLTELVDAMLPRLPQMLDCDAVALFLDEGTGNVALRAIGEGEDGGQDPARAGAETVTRQALRRRWPSLEWTELPIRLGGRQRGALLCARGVGRPLPAALRRQAKGVARRLAVALRNEEREALLVHQAFYDGLTGLPNRRLLQDRVQQARVEARNSGSHIALLYLDVDRFKNLNDSLGHRAGDGLLAQIGSRLSAVIGAGDTVARLGGDEFAMVLVDGSPAHVSAVVSRLLLKLQEPLAIDGMTISPQASIGIAIYPEDGEDFDTLLRNADAAMYRAKSQGGGRAVFFEDGMNRQAIRRLQLESGLRRALAQGRFRLAYQPKVYLQDGSWAGVEALLRWSDPELGEVAPAEFIPVAEDSGLIHELGRHVLREAIGFCRRCLDEGAPIGHVAVNVSMLQLRDSSLVDLLAEQLQQLRLPPGMLQIEVTESAVMQDPELVAAILASFRRMGVRVAIDDFGTGYSSLAILQKLPVDQLKIDRSFITDIGANPQAMALVRAMLAVAGTLDLEVVAEGVETREQAGLLAARGCRIAQGFYFSRPVEAEAAAALARDWDSTLEPVAAPRLAGGERL